MTIDLYERLQDANPVPRDEDYDQARTAAILAQIIEPGTADVPSDRASDRARPLQPGRTRRHRVVELATVAVLALVVGGLVPWLGHGSSQIGASGPGQGPSPTVTTAAASGPARTGRLAYRGVTVPVPPSMLDPANLVCQYAIADAAYIVKPTDPDIYSLCAPPSDNQGVTLPMRPVTEVILMASQAAERVGEQYIDGESMLRDGRTQIVTTFDAQHVVLIVRSPDPELARSYTGDITP